MLLLTAEYMYTAAYKAVLPYAARANIALGANIGILAQVGILVRKYGQEPDDDLPVYVVTALRIVSCAQIHAYSEGC